MENTKNDSIAVLRAAFKAWSNGNALRKRRLRNKRFTYGDQWIDITTDRNGRKVTEWERYCNLDGAPVTNNVLRQLVKTIVGRFRAQYINGGDPTIEKSLKETCDFNQIDELDCRLLEEFLISGCCIQRVDEVDEPGHKSIEVNNVNLNRFFVNEINDPLARDCEIIGQIHDLSIAQLIKLVAPGQRKKATWVRRIYSENADERTANFTASIGADNQSGADFWHCAGNKCRAIEVWTLESHEVLVCHDRNTAQVYTASLSHAKKLNSCPHIETHWDIATNWHCRWFSPMGDLLCEYDSPFGHNEHPFILKMYPLTDGEVHSFIEDVIDQQKFVNRLITLVDHVMNASAKGVLLFPDTALPDGLRWDDVQRIWRNSDGILPYSPHMGEAKPEQVSKNNTNFGAYEMIQLQLKLLEEISGVSGALQGKNINTSGSVTLYKEQVDNSSIALTDIFDTFNNFRNQRNRKKRLMLSDNSPLNFCSL